MKQFLTKSFIAILCLLPIAASANYTVTPVKLNIKPGSTMASLTIQNNGDSNRSFQVRVYQTDEHGVNLSQEETKDLVVSPSMFKATEKKGQVIRVAVKNPDMAFKHKHYIISVMELPRETKDENTIKLVTDFRVPVLVGEGAAAAAAEESKE